MTLMVRKETCPACKGNRWLTVKDTSGRDVHRKCPTCGGQGYKISVQR
jgi:excinuclease UvrABC ATPase subunit